MAGADGGGVEGTGAEGCVLACDAAVYGVGGVDDEAVGDGEAVDGCEDDAVKVQWAVVEAGDVTYCGVSVAVLRTVRNSAIYLPTLFGWQAAYSVG